MNPIPMPADTAFAREMEVAIDAATRAATVINRFYAEHTASTYTKGDGSPVTDADIAADATIREVISAAFPNDGFITEEGEHDPASRNNERVWIVDPIDGTAEYIAGSGRFDVLIALATHGEPVVAATIQPTTGLMHAAIAGTGAWRWADGAWEPYRLSAPASPPRLVASRYYLLEAQKASIESVAERLGATTPPIMNVGFQPRAMDDIERWYDVFIGMPQDPARFAAREWDIAASDLIMREAGGELTDCWGRRHRYNKRDTHIVGGVIASASPELHEQVIAALVPTLSGEAPEPDPEPRG